MKLKRGIYILAAILLLLANATSSYLGMPALTKILGLNLSENLCLALSFMVSIGAVVIIGCGLASHYSGKKIE